MVFFGIWCLADVSSVSPSSEQTGDKLAKFDGMMLKIERALILCSVAVFAKTSLEKFTPKVRRTSYNFTSGENSHSSYLANY